MDFEISEAFSWNLENHFQTTSLMHENQQARFISTLFVKSAVV